MKKALSREDCLLENAKIESHMFSFGIRDCQNSTARHWSHVKVKVDKSQQRIRMIDAPHLLASACTL